MCEFFFPMCKDLDEFLSDGLSDWMNEWMNAILKIPAWLPLCICLLEFNGVDTAEYSEHEYRIAEIIKYCHVFS